MIVIVYTKTEQSMVKLAVFSFSMILIVYSYVPAAIPVRFGTISFSS